MLNLRAALLFFGCLLLGMSLGAALAQLIAFLAGDIKPISSLPTFIQQVAQLPNGWYIFIAGQAISHLFTYLIPALFYWYRFEHNRWTDFQTKPLKAVAGLWVGLLSVIVILPFNELIINWNQHLELPRLLGNLGGWMHRKQQESTSLTNQLVAFNSVNQFLIAILVIGFIASIGEEVFFRAIIQRKLIEWTANVHAGIWVAALLFSAFHFQFYGFFPRVVLGVLFGYLYVWSGNIWVAILAHFINNSLIVITTYIQRQPAYLQLEVKVDTGTWFWVISSAIGVLILLFYFHQLNHKRKVA
ncbi:CPBP family intramembrane metalloprotease [Spirosoma sp. HMF3257]|uniref:CPBP family intramembrane metalloprotease n=1 Tax=Spirosoma telluris TaxID=2183553 RepID=A0A327NP68_9BACT|nr:CPBP family intramembrane metalloprotease [Spirosoma telluris]RAI75806.1 CPBP family intramembrane metalloprotease [Spirosoma telluris]